MPENSAEMFSRVRLMAKVDTDWDLSDNDTAALRHVLAAAEAREAGEQNADQPGLRRALAIAKGCEDYGGGYSGEKYDAYHHGMQTVQRCIQAAIDGDTSLQLRVVEGIGAAACKDQPSAAEVIAAYVEDHGITCDCCQHIMIDVTAVRADVEQHCVAGDSEGYGSACAWGFHYDEGEKKKLAKEEAVRAAAEVIAAAKKALERILWDHETVIAMELEAKPALAKIAAWEAAQG